VKKALNYLLDFLLFVVPIMELTEMLAIMPTEYLPFYMLGTVLLRRGVRLLGDYLDKNTDETFS